MMLVRRWKGVPRRWSWAIAAVIAALMLGGAFARFDIGPTSAATAVSCSGSTITATGTPPTFTPTVTNTITATPTHTPGPGTPTVTPTNTPVPPTATPTCASILGGVDTGGPVSASTRSAASYAVVLAALVAVAGTAAVSWRVRGRE